MSDILNCGGAKQKSELVSFSYQCPKHWQNMQVTENDSVRFCNACQSNVYYCTDRAEAEQQARQGHCVAIAAKSVANLKNQPSNSDLAIAWDTLDLGDMVAGMMEIPQTATPPRTKVIEDKVYED